MAMQVNKRMKNIRNGIYFIVFFLASMTWYMYSMEKGLHVVDVDQKEECCNGKKKKPKNNKKHGDSKVKKLEDKTDGIEKHKETVRKSLEQNGTIPKDVAPEALVNRLKDSSDYLKNGIQTTVLVQALKKRENSSQADEILILTAALEEQRKKCQNRSSQLVEAGAN